MKIFISWSGDLSRRVAEALRDWLPDVIQSIEPFMSEKDIGSGKRWGAEIAAELEASQFGIVCVVPGNKDAPWLNFEAGAIAKSIEEGRVCPLLVGVSKADLTYPLAQFQARAADNEGEMRQFIQDVNASMGADALPPDRLKSAFDHWWPELESKLEALQREAEASRAAEPEAEPRDSASTKQAGRLDQILDEVRTMGRYLRKIKAETPSSSSTDGLAQLRAFNARVAELKTQELEAMRKLRDSLLRSRGGSRDTRALGDMQSRIDTLRKVQADVEAVGAPLLADPQGLLAEAQSYLGMGEAPPTERRSQPHE